MRAVTGAALGGNRLAFIEDPTLINARNISCFLWGPVTLLILWPISLTLQAANIKIADVTLGLQDIESVLRSLSVNVSIDVRQSSFTHPAAVAHMSREEHYLFELDGRARCKISGQTFKVNKQGTAIIRPFVSAGTFDDNECRLARGKQGMITDNRSDLPWTMDPRDLITRYYGRPISEIITDNGGEVVGRVNHGGRRLLVVETRVVKREQNWRYRFWIDPRRNFAVVKRAQLIQFPSHANWLEFTRITWEELQEVQPGIWLPRRAINESYNPTEEHADGRSTMPLAWRFEITCNDWLVNPTTDDAAFALDFAPGTKVEDRINGRTYVVSSVNDNMLDTQANTAREWEHAYDRRWIIGANGLAVLILAAWLIWRRQYA